LTNLFILGNGFDIAHGLATKYQDFHNYLLRVYPKAAKLSPSFSIDSSIMPDGEEVFDENEVVAFIMDIISEAEEEGNNWSDVETSLGKLDFERYLDDMSLLFNLDDDKELFRMAYRYEDVSNNFHKVIVKIKDLFSDWINSIDVLEVSSKIIFKDLINEKNDLFLNFNYTSILEEIYDVQNVYYIHGMQNGEIIFGHGEEKNNFENIYTGSEFALAEIHLSLKKDTTKSIEEAKLFFSEFSSVKKIYSYGFSFSRVDLPYIREICKKCNTKKCIWYLSNFESEQKREGYKKIIADCGFEGKFAVFGI